MLISLQDVNKSSNCMFVVTLRMDWISDHVREAFACVRTKRNMILFIIIMLRHRYGCIHAPLSYYH